VDKPLERSRIVDWEGTESACRTPLLPIEVDQPMTLNSPRPMAALVLCASVLWSTPTRAADDDILYVATITDNEQSVPTESPGKGVAEFRLERATLKLSWKITYQGLTSKALSIGLYGPENVGANAGRVVDLGTNGLKSPITGSAILSDGVLSYLVTGRTYVNLHTARYKDGELRGQVRRIRTPKVAPTATPAHSS
jgi:hypothetical protein